MENRWQLIQIVLLAVLVNGCGRSVHYTSEQEAKVIKPKVAVMPLENRCRVPVSWQIGDGLAEELVERMRVTRRFNIVNRSNFIANTPSRSYFTRPASSTQPAFSMDPDYVITGRVTDFGISNAPQGWFGKIDESLFGKDTDHVVSVHFQITDKAQDRIIASFTSYGKVTTSPKKANVPYETMAFGGFNFYETPMGQATDKMLEEALRQITEAIQEKPFRITVASVINKQVVLNAGKDRLIRIGEEFIIRPEPKAITDPDSGAVIGRYSGEPVGRIRIVQVTQKYAIGDIIQFGEFKAGQLAEKIAPNMPTPKDTAFTE